MLKLMICSVGVLFLIGCTKTATKNETGLALISDAQNIVSTRGTDDDQFFALVKLTTPCLLSQSTRMNGVTVINQDLKSQIETEQSAAIAELQKLSSDIQIVFRYKMVLNALAVIGPRAALDKVSTIGLVASVEKVGSFQRNNDKVINQNSTGAAAGALINSASADDLKSHNSVKFIGAEELHKLGLTGRGVKIGIIDTGIDYTHAMFGGVGTAEGYKAINPSASNPNFPTNKVVGGIDLVGTEYDSASLDFVTRIPKPDLNPIDEAGHGSHVAGTIAGHGDGINSYDGVAPDASLYAIKVFGANGSTSDMVVIAGLEYAADPNQDGLLDDQLDVVNLSLGSSYGTPKLLYAEAIKNLVRGGTAAIISAGNSGHESYIVGSPGTATEALSVAASVDDTDHNWIFNSSKIIINQEETYVESIEAATTKSVTEGSVSGEFYYIGAADKDLTADQMTGLNGKVALIDRGLVSFNDKIKRAVSGNAIGVVVVNNKPNEAAFQMGSTDNFNIPAIMISFEVGAKIKSVLSSNPAGKVSIEFLSDKKIQKPELVDTITDFSSKGPRSIDGYLKPEIAAPGSEIISASFGTGNKVVKMSGTSMAAPHMTGVMALLKQNYTEKNFDLSALQLKNIAMATSHTLAEGGVVYPVSLQGAGRVDALKGTKAIVVADLPSISFGEISIASKSTYEKNIYFQNLSGVDLSGNLALSFVFEGHPGVKLLPTSNLNLSSNKTQSVVLKIEIDPSLVKNSIEEYDGRVLVMQSGVEVYRLPLLAVVHKQSNITVKSSVVQADNKLNITLQNSSENKGEVLLFNLISSDDRKKAPIDGRDILNTDCDMQSAGYRIVTKKNNAGIDTKYVQFAVKTFKPMTTWNSCDVSILFDSKKTGNFDQELVGTNLATIPGQAINQFASVLIDTTSAQQIRKSFEAELKAAKGDTKKMQAIASTEDYTTAISDIQEMKLFNDSTLVILEADLAQINKDESNNLNFKILTSYSNGSTAEFDDYLKTDKVDEAVFIISVNEDQNPYFGFNDNLVDDVIGSKIDKSFQISKGKTNGLLIGYYPQNDFSLTDFKLDQQSQIIDLK